MSHPRAPGLSRCPLNPGLLSSFSAPLRVKPKMPKSGTKLLNPDRYGFCGVGTTSKQLNIRYHPHAGATPEAERIALAAAYRLILTNAEEPKSTQAVESPATDRSVRGDSDGTRIEEDSADATSIPD